MQFTDLITCILKRKITAQFQIEIKYILKKASNNKNWKSSDFTPIKINQTKTMWIETICQAWSRNIWKGTRKRDKQTKFNNATDWFGYTEGCCVLHLLASLLMFFCFCCLQISVGVWGIACQHNIQLQCTVTRMFDSGLTRVWLVSFCVWLCLD